MSTQTQFEQLARPAAGEPVLRFERVSLSFPGLRVLEDISFSVARGETKVIFGESGTGKTLILKLALGLLRPDAGRVFLLGEEVSALPEERLYALRRQVGMVFQESALFDSLTVRENVAYRLKEEQERQHAKSDEEIEARVHDCLRFVELEEAIDKMPAELSGGMQRRVSIARAVAAEPEVLLYDSPTGGLDPVTATTIMELIVRLRDERQVTGLLVTHRLQDGYLMATSGWDSARKALVPIPAERSHTTFLILRERRVVFDGTGEQLRESPDAYIRDYLS